MKQNFEKSELPKLIAWIASAVDDIKSDRVTVEVKEYRRKRSLDANAYCWVLIDKLAEKLHHTLKQDSEKVKVRIYREAIRDIGGVSDTFCSTDKAAERFISAWESRGIGWQCETFPSKIEGCTNITAYYGSSTYDTVQMSRLIDHLVQECKTQGIETLPPHELEGLIEKWWHNVFYAAETAAATGWNVIIFSAVLTARTVRNTAWSFICVVSGVTVPGDTPRITAVRQWTTYGAKVRRWQRNI